MKKILKPDDVIQVGDIVREYPRYGNDRTEYTILQSSDFLGRKVSELIEGIDTFSITRETTDNSIEKYPPHKVQPCGVLAVGGEKYWLLYQPPELVEQSVWWGGNKEIRFCVVSFETTEAPQRGEQIYSYVRYLVVCGDFHVEYRHDANILVKNIGEDDLLIST